MRARPKLLKLLIGSLDFHARGQRVIAKDSCYNEAHDDLTFNVIGATMESPSQMPLLAYINQEFGGQ